MADKEAVISITVNLHPDDSISVDHPAAKDVKAMASYAFILSSGIGVLMTQGIIEKEANDSLSPSISG